MKKYILLPLVVFIWGCQQDIMLEKAEYITAREKDFISCVEPLFVKNLNKIHIKNNEGKLVYIVELQGSQGKCNWERDKLLFKKGSPMNEVNDIVQQFDSKIYFNTTLYISFKVTKVSNEKPPFTLIKVPYFVMLLDDVNTINRIDSSIDINLKEVNKLQNGGKITFNHTFSASKFKNVQILAGIYVKNKPQK